MRTVRTFVVVPSLPERLQSLREIAYNIWWSWDRDAIDLFRRLDRDLWEASGHNPVKMLGLMPQEKLDAAAQDDSLLAYLGRVEDKLRLYMNSPRWYDNLDPAHSRDTIAYFSAEYGLTECLPIYSGGLGILSGDHLKSASDLGIPLVGVGLLYRQGYFQQYLNADGWQQESYPENDFYNMPVTLVMREDGRPVRFHIEIMDRDVVVQIWKIQVGRVNLYLLDTNLRCNKLEDRQITSQLYGGDSEMRIRQEILLGIGGLRALQALGIEPKVCHMNEGHAAFLGLERIRLTMEKHQVNFAQAREATVGGHVFTTHTPVPAGHDVFGPALMEKYFSNYAKKFQISWEDFLALGRIRKNDPNESFSMTSLAIRLSSCRNGVSQLHGKISRAMCKSVWTGDIPIDEVPITSITNGIHIRSWVSRDMRELYDRYLGPRWSDSYNDASVFGRVGQIPDEELWRTHERRRERLVAYCRGRVRQQLMNRGANQTEIAMADEVLDPEALTIGFARRFATYKRGTLLFKDMERFARIISDKDRPVQLIFAGKAHPRDVEGKELIRKLIHSIRRDDFRRRVVFLENYDINVARTMVQGVDVWLNTPRWGMEASGTSGMKVLANGGLNLSVPDGWWCEGYSLETGWAIGRGENYEDQEYQDAVESRALYDLLEKEVIPHFYQRSSDRLPRSWIRMMKSSMGKLTGLFSTSRMVAEYTEGFYLPSAQRFDQFTANNLEKAKALADWKDSMRDRWGEVAIGKVDKLSPTDLQVGGMLEVRGQVRLGTIDPRDVAVELYQGRVDSHGNIEAGEAVAMKPLGDAHDGWHIFTGKIPCRHSGQCGFAVRVIAAHPDLVDKYDTGLIRWDEDESAVDKEALEDKAAAKC